MPYLVDTDWMVDCLDEVPEAVRLFDAIAADGVAISIITYLELSEGVLRSADANAGEQQLNAVLNGIPLLLLSRSIARRCASIRHALRQAGKRVNSRALDLIIAATAIEHGLTLVTRNLDAYADIADLSIYQAPFQAPP